jgi:hypothetical protein
VPVPGVYRVAVFADQGRAEESVEVDRDGTARVLLVVQP